MNVIFPYFNYVVSMQLFQLLIASLWHFYYLDTKYSNQKYLIGFWSRILDGFWKFFTFLVLTTFHAKFYEDSRYNNQKIINSILKAFYHFRNQVKGGFQPPFTWFLPLHHKLCSSITLNFFLFINIFILPITNGNTTKIRSYNIFKKILSTHHKLTIFHITNQNKT